MAAQTEQDRGNHETKLRNNDDAPHHDAGKKSAEPKRNIVGEKLTSASEKRRERIRQLEARLERERSRESAASRKERNGQLFVWGAMVEGVYRNGGEQERDLLRQWAAKHLTDKRHHQRAELGFVRVDEEKAHRSKADAQPTA